jgi:hypothetical protein
LVETNTINIPKHWGGCSGKYYAKRNRFMTPGFHQKFYGGRNAALRPMMYLRISKINPDLLTQFLIYWLYGSIHYLKNQD